MAKPSSEIVTDEAEAARKFEKMGTDLEEIKDFLFKKPKNDPAPEIKPKLTIPAKPAAQGNGVVSFLQNMGVLAKPSVEE
jgi:hypothetical protein